jgi:hypothetical protein
MYHVPMNKRSAQKALSYAVVGLATAALWWAAWRAVLPKPPGRDVEIQVYEAVLQSWYGSQELNVLVDDRLAPPPVPSDEEISECLEGLDFRQGPRPVLDSLRGAAFNSRAVQIVDGAAWHPEDQQLNANVAQGKFEDADLERAFSHALISFSHIQFDRDGQLALLRFSHQCGELCGTGSTLLVRKSGNIWEVAKGCRTWLS